MIGLPTVGTLINVASFCLLRMLSAYLDIAEEFLGFLDATHQNKDIFSQLTIMLEKEISARIIKVQKEIKIRAF